MSTTLSCEVCGVGAPITHRTNCGYRCCEGCAAIVDPYKELPVRPIGLELAQVILTIRTALGSADFSACRSESDAQAVIAKVINATPGVGRAETAEMRKERKAPPIAVRSRLLAGRNAFHDVHARGNGYLIAIEVKLFDPDKNNNDEVCRGIGQCLVYCEGDARGFDGADGDRDRYDAAVLLIVEDGTEHRDVESVQLFHVTTSCNRLFSVHCFRRPRRSAVP